MKFFFGSDSIGEPDAPRTLTPRGYISVNKGLALIRQFVNPTETLGRAPALIAGQAYHRWTTISGSLLGLERSRATGIALIEQFTDYRVAALAFECGFPVAVVAGSQPELTPFLSAIRDGIFKPELERLWGDSVALQELTELMGIQALLRASNNHCGRILARFSDDSPVLLRFLPGQASFLPQHRIVTTVGQTLVEVHRLGARIRSLHRPALFGNGYLFAGPAFSRLRLGHFSGLQRDLLKLLDQTPAVPLSIAQLLVSQKLASFQLGDVALAVDGLLTAGFLTLRENPDPTPASPLPLGFLELSPFGSVIAPNEIEESTRQLIREYNDLNLTALGQRLEEAVSLLFKLSPDRFVAANHLQRRAIRDVFEYLLKRVTGEKPGDLNFPELDPERSFPEITLLGDNQTPVEVRAFHIRGVLLGRIPFLYGLDSMVAALVYSKERGPEWLRHLLFDIVREQAENPGDAGTLPLDETLRRNIDLFRSAWRCASTDPTSFPEALFTTLVDSFPLDPAATLSIRATPA